MKGVPEGGGVQEVRHPVREQLTSLATGLMLGTLLLVVAAPPAPAAAACGGAIGVSGYHDDGQASHFGNRVTGPGLYVTNPSVTANCYIVRSLYVVSNQNNFVEVGWAKDEQGVTTGCVAADGPRFFNYGVVQGFMSCQVGVRLNSGNFYGVRVANPGHDDTWKFWLDGQPQGNKTTNFSAGYVYSSTERHNQDDSNFGEFDGLEWMGAAGGWNAYDLQGDDNDPGYKFCKENNAHWLSYLQGATCP